MKKNIKVSAVIVAAGNGSRMENKCENKIFLSLGGKSVIEHTVSAFEACTDIDEITVVARESDIPEMWDHLKEYIKVVSVVAGGSSRTESVLAGLESISPDATHIALHDGARPFVTPELISAVISDAVLYGNAVAGIAETDTVKRVSSDNFICETVPRDSLRRIQTPQVFNVKDFINAVNAAGNAEFTDDSAFIEQFGGRVYITRGNSNNIKLTTPQDIELAEGIILQRRGG